MSRVNDVAPPIDPQTFITSHAGFEDDNVLYEGKPIGRIYNAKSSGNAKPWFWGCS